MSEQTCPMLTSTSGVVGCEVLARLPTPGSTDQLNKGFGLITTDGDASNLGEITTAYFGSDVFFARCLGKRDRAHVYSLFTQTRDCPPKTEMGNRRGISIPQAIIVFSSPVILCNGD